MGSILSAISGQFSKLIILGTFLPTAIFVSLSWIFLVPLIPTDWPFVKQMEVLDTQNVIVISLLTIGLSAVLYNLNIPIIRLYEGYPWKDSWIGERRIRHHQKKWAAANARWTGMRTLIRQISRKPDQDHDQIKGRWDKFGQELNREIPDKKYLVLPTRLGNAIRSFEYYPNHQYGIDDVTLWPRLISQIDKEYAVHIDDAKTSFDFMLNSSLLFTILALGMLIAGLLYPNRLISDQGWNWVTIETWSIKIALLLMVAYFFYHQSVSRAFAWGDTAKSAFDLYRWKLLKQIGYNQVPKSKADEYQLWNEISQRIIYGKHPTRPESLYDSVPQPPRSTASVSSEIDGQAFEITRGVKIQDNRTIIIVLHIKRTDKRRNQATRVVVTDTMPDGFDYEWNSVQPSAIDMSGVNPMRFEVAIMAGREMYITYRAIRREPVYPT